MYFVFNKSHMFVRLNLVANLMYIIYINNTLPLATDLYMKLYTELGRLWSEYLIRKAPELSKDQYFSSKNNIKRLTFNAW